MILNEDSASSNSTNDTFLPNPSKRCRMLPDSEESRTEEATREEARTRQYGKIHECTKS